MIRGVRTLSRAMLLGFLRDRASLFFAVLFPLLFLVLFGGIFTDQGAENASTAFASAIAIMAATIVLCHGEHSAIRFIILISDKQGCVRSRIQALANHRHRKSIMLSSVF